MKKLAILIALMGGPAWAQSLDSGNTLHDRCSNGGMESAVCVGYIIGAWEGLFIGSLITDMQTGAAQSPDKQSHRTRKILGICTTDYAMRDQVVDVVVEYLKNHPKWRAQPAAGLIHAAMAEAFPCE